jgi:hypothetical protein
MRRSVKLLVTTAVMGLAFAAPAHAGIPRTAIWRCEVPGEGTVDFVTAAEGARYGLGTANAHAGQTFITRFGDVCTVI